MRRGTVVSLGPVKGCVTMGDPGVVMPRYLPYLLVVALWIYAFVDCLSTPEQEVRGCRRWCGC